MSFGFAVGDFIAVAQLASKVRNEWAAATGQYDGICQETKSLENVLREVNRLQQCVTLSTKQETDVRQASQSCEQVLHELEAIVKKHAGIQRAGSDAKSRIKRNWSHFKLDTEVIKDMRGRLQSTTVLLTAVLTSIERDSALETKSMVISLNKRQIDQHWETIANWISPANFVEDQITALAARSTDTGMWFLNDVKYLDWLHGLGSTLLCQGIPGAGKTVLAAIVVDDLRRHAFPDTTVVYFYCKYKRRAGQDLGHFLSCIIRQVLQEQDSIGSDVEKLYNSHHKQGTRPSISELTSLLSSLLSQYAKCFLVIDGLDEYENRHRKRDLLLDTVFGLQKLPQCKVNILATTRYSREILNRFTKFPNIEIRADPTDIARYVNSRIPELGPRVVSNTKVCEEIKAFFVSLVDGMFLLARLHFNSLEDKTTPTKVRRALDAMPRGEDALDSVYAEAIQRIDNQLPGLREIAKHTLTLITYSRRELSADEVKEALAIECGMNYEELGDNMEDEDTIVEVCAGLVVLDPESRVLHLVHYTTQEYLEQVRDKWLPNGESFISRKCLSYLSMDDFPIIACKDIATIEQKLALYKFLGYAAVYYGNHVKASNCKQVEATCFDYFQQRRYVFTNQVRWLEQYGKFGAFATSDGSVRCPVRAAVYFDLASLVDYELDNNRWPPLPPNPFASQHRSSPEPKPSPMDLDTPIHLHGAASSGSVDTMKLLVDKYDQDINSQDGKGRTPLYLAAMHGQVEAAKTILAYKQVQVELASNSGDTALHVAAAVGDITIVKLLLDHSKHLLNLGNIKMETPLALAVVPCQTHIVDYLLTYDGIDVNLPDTDGRTPLSKATRPNNIPCMNSLLTHCNITIDSEDGDGHTPLSYATVGGSIESMSLLIDKKRMILEKKDRNQQSLLALAAIYDQAESARLLLTYPEIDINSRDVDGQTPLMLAAGLGREAIVRLLIEHRADRNIVNLEGQTAISLVKSILSSRYTQSSEKPRYEAISKLLTDTNGPNDKLTGSQRRTPSP